MHASRFVGLTVLGIAGASLSLMASCSVGEPGGGSAGGEVTAAVHDLRCSETYCYCVRDGHGEQLCRDLYCEGGPHWDGTDADCTDILGDSSGGMDHHDGTDLQCSHWYCECAGLNGNDAWPGMTEKDCRKYCKGGTDWDGTDVMCGVKPEEPKCDPGYCDCLDTGIVLESTCRQLYCNGHTPDIPCAVTPTCQNPQKDSTASAFLSSRTTSSTAPSKPWSDVHHATVPNADGAHVILQPNEVSDSLVLHNAANLTFPANVERILSVRVHFQARAGWGGYSAYTGEARLIQSGECNDPVEETIYPDKYYGRYSFSNGGSGTVWGAPGGESTLSVEDFQAPGFGVCFRARATQGLTRAAVDSAYVSVTYETCDP